MKAVPDQVVETPGHDALWQWFGLSYASFLVLPRVLMHEMPDDWQRRMAELLAEYDAAFPFLEAPAYRPHVTLRDNSNRFVTTPDWLVNYRHPNRPALREGTR